MTTNLEEEKTKRDHHTSINTDYAKLHGDYNRESLSQQTHTTEEYHITYQKEDHYKPTGFMGHR